MLFGVIITSYYINKFPPNPESLCAYWASSMGNIDDFSISRFAQHSTKAPSIWWIPSNRSSVPQRTVKLLSSSRNQYFLSSEFVADAIDKMLRFVENWWHLTGHRCSNRQLSQRNSSGALSPKQPWPQNQKFPMSMSPAIAHHLRQEDKNTMFCRFMTCIVLV